MGDQWLSDDRQRDADNAERAYQKWVREGGSLFAGEKDHFLAGWHAAVAWYLEDE